METTASDVANSVADEAANELFAALHKIEHCLAQLDEDQLWQRPHPSMNSVANLLLHLGGNVRQWIVSGVGGAKDVRDRPSEFAACAPTEKSVLLKQLQGTLDEARNSLAQLTPTELLRVRRIQGSDVTGMQAIFHSVAHFQGHAQEIVHLTRCLLGADYEFDFVPQSTEEGAPTADS